MTKPAFVPRFALSLLLPVLGLGAIAATVALTPDSAQAADPKSTAPVSVDELLSGFAKMPGLYAEFRQESHFGLLAAPLIDTGTIHFADGRLARRTLDPTPSVVVMDDAGIEYGDAESQQRIDLDGKPAVRQFVEAFTKIFAGDRAGLEALYRIQFQAGEGRSWTMTLVPKVSPMDQIIAKVEVTGTELEIAKMRVVETSGDETTTFFAKVDTARKYSKDEKKRLFSVAL